MTKLTPRPVPDAGLAPLLPRVDPIEHLPIVILYPHSRCNCRCVMCDIWRITDKREIDPGDLASWLPEWRRLGVRRVVLSGGEPLMHSSFSPLCEALRGADIGITLLSTGLLLSRHAADVARYCDDVVVSLDGPRAVHNEVRNIPRAYEKLRDGVRAVKAQGSHIAVSGRCTVQRANYRFLRETIAAAHELGLDRISFLAADVSTDAFNRPDGWTTDRVQDVALAEADLPVLAEELAALERECAADFAGGYIAESPEKLRRRLLQYFGALHGRAEFHPNDCNAPWVSTVIEVDGTVRPCFFQPALGNVHAAGSLDAVLNSPEALAWRRGLDTHRDAICRKCVCSLSLRSSDEVPPAV
jgi:MoaA/NifB/PqqE/SkfB family radical SAM enzyme